MDKESLIKLVANKAMGYLEYDDDHPNVGMGMFVGHAVELAEQDVLEEAARWNSLAALALNFDSIRDDVVALVRSKRTY